MGGAIRPGGHGPRVLAMAAAAAQPRYLLRGRRPPDGAHRDGPRGAMSDQAKRRYPILYSVQRWNDGKWFYGGVFFILVWPLIINDILPPTRIFLIPAPD